MANVLKITRIACRERMQTLKLEGQLLKPWVHAVLDMCATPHGRSGRLCLDLTAVNYVDAAGLHLLRELMLAGIEIAAWSSYIGELLHLEDSGTPGAGGAPESSYPPSAPSDRP
jgi:hypothetical protein